MEVIPATTHLDDDESTILSSQDRIQALEYEIKILKGKIRGYQRLGLLFQELKEKHRILEMERQNKEMVSVATETSNPASLGPMDFSSDIIPTVNSDPGISNQLLSGITGPNKIPEEIMAQGAREKERHFSTNTDPMFPLKVSSSYPPMENSENPEENNLLLRRKLEDALYLVGEFERKRSNDKKLVKVLNEELKKRKDELDTVNKKLQDLQQEKALMMMKIAKLERERDNLPLNTGAATTTVALEVEGVEDWVHLQKETIPENDYKLEQLRNKCKELEEKASRWENEHFNLQMESSKHVNDLRVLLENKSKELIKITESLNSEKRILESKFKKLETMLQEEKDAKFESYSMHQETMRKYKVLEKKFLALEQKNRSTPMEYLDPREICATTMGQAYSNAEQNSMLKQQLAIFKEDFEKERRECLSAQKLSKTFEEKLHNMTRQVEKKDNEIAKYEKSLGDERTKNAKYLQRINKLEKDHKMVLQHNHMLMELQSKMKISIPFKMTEPTVIPPSAPTAEIPTIHANFWSCKICTYQNDLQAENCNMCKAQKSSQRGQNLPRFTPRWQCICCTYQNNPTSDTCNICKSPRPRSSSNLDEAGRLTRRLSKQEEEKTEPNLFDNDLTIDGPPTDGPPTGYHSKQ